MGNCAICNDLHLPRLQPEGFHIRFWYHPGYCPGRRQRLFFIRGVLNSPSTAARLDALLCRMAAIDCRKQKKRVK